MLATILFFNIKREEIVPISIENVTEKPGIKLISVYDNYKADRRRDSKTLLFNMEKLGLNPPLN